MRSSHQWKSWPVTVSQQSDLAAAPSPHPHLYSSRQDSRRQAPLSSQVWVSTADSLNDLVRMTCSIIRLDRTKLDWHNRQVPVHGQSKVEHYDCRFISRTIGGVTPKPLMHVFLIHRTAEPIQLTFCLLHGSSKKEMAWGGMSLENGPWASCLGKLSP